MSFPIIFSKLFKNAGAGKELKDDVIPSVPYDIYVNGTTGDDSNPGTLQAPLKTITAAQDLTGNRFATYANYVIHIEAGDYSEESVLGFAGKHIFYKAENGNVKVKNFYFIQKGVSLYGSWECNRNSGAVMQVVQSAVRLCDGFSLKVSGTGMTAVLYVSAGSSLLGEYLASLSFNLTTSSGTQVLFVSSNSEMIFGDSTITWSGQFTGLKYKVQYGGMLNLSKAVNKNIPATGGTSVDETSISI